MKSIAVSDEIKRKFDAIQMQVSYTLGHKLSQDDTIELMVEYTIETFHEFKSLKWRDLDKILKTGDQKDE